jgi:hypothetical protein
LKARQKGLSKVIDADQLVDCTVKSTNAVVISHEQGATKRLFAAVRYYLDNMTVKPVVSIDSTNELRFPKRGSSYFIGTAGQRAFGRGDTVDRAHLSEAAFYPDLERTMNGVAEACEYGQIDVETTANGREQVFDMWQKAKSGKSSYTPIFIPWFIDREYSVENMTEKEIAGLSAGVREMFSIPDIEFIAMLTPEEKLLVARVAEEWSTVLTAGQLKWRRAKIWDKGEMFFQEYPEDDVSCFLQSGRSVFNHVVVDPRRKIPLDDLESWDATDEEKKDLHDCILYGGLDGAEGTETGDAHSFAVIDSRKQPAVVIYEYTSNEPIDVFDGKVARICNQFNILLGIEHNGVGAAHCLKMESLGVDFESWDTGAANRPTIITDLEEAYRKENLIETYPEAEGELKTMIYTEKRTNSSSLRAEASKKHHDDRVFARIIAWQMREVPTAGLTVI